MKPADIAITVLVAVIWGFAFIASRLALDEFSPELMTTLRFHPAAQVVPFALLVPFVGSGASSIVFGEKFGTLRLAGMLTVIAGIAVMLLSKRPQALPRVAGA
jgi:drug/metabolite transporter (DMT)-like permease